MIVPVQVSSCRACPYSDNSAMRHDDPFTSTPANNTWFCNHPERNKYYDIIENENIIDKRCPINKEVV